MGKCFYKRISRYCSSQRELVERLPKPPKVRSRWRFTTFHSEIRVPLVRIDLVKKRTPHSILYLFHSMQIFDLIHIDAHWTQLVTYRFKNTLLEHLKRVFAVKNGVYGPLIC
ncbi:hypothetical protein BRADI_5g19955v3 [Brachypodium distachyon]|uniref:Uncharacterized protein n=1 Tax=Brachypodium distachyon TaxID=15368 RepID=A0A2K2CI79_BRADI|nr:hypothetical protein BRADI_5g19955v3 [Brachypodium distachyon]